MHGTTPKVRLNQSFSWHVSDLLELAYFEASEDAALGIVGRAWFERRLQAFHNSEQPDNDLAWYALRNAVYATGSRVLLARTLGFCRAQEDSWPFFENALSVHTQIIYWQTTVIGVQALAVMVG